MWPSRGLVAPSILQEWDISRPAFGIVISAAPFGLVIGALVAGPSSDRFGRKIVLIISVLLFGPLTLVIAYASSPTEMAILRLLAGMGMGAAMPNASTLLSEYAPQRRRSLMITIMFTGLNLGSAAIGFAAGHLIPVHGWRSVLLLGGAVPLLLVPVLVLFLPESARLLALRGAASKKIAATLGRVSGFRFSGDETFVSAEPPLQTRKPIGVLFSHGYSTTTISLWITYFARGGAHRLGSRRRSAAQPRHRRAPGPDVATGSGDEAGGAGCPHPGRALGRADRRDERSAAVVSTGFTPGAVRRVQLSMQFRCPTAARRGDDLHGGAAHEAAPVWAVRRGRHSHHRRHPCPITAARLFLAPGGTQRRRHHRPEQGQQLGRRAQHCAEFIQVAERCPGEPSPRPAARYWYPGALAPYGQAFRPGVRQPMMASAREAARRAASPRCPACGRARTDRPRRRRRPTRCCWSCPRRSSAPTPETSAGGRRGAALPGPRPARLHAGPARPKSRRGRLRAGRLRRAPAGAGLLHLLVGHRRGAECPGVAALGRLRGEPQRPVRGRGLCPHTALDTGRVRAARAAVRGRAGNALPQGPAPRGHAGRPRAAYRSGPAAPPGARRGHPPGRVVPPASVLDALPADLPRRALYHAGDRGPALRHLGPLVSPAAHARLWPESLDRVMVPRHTPDGGKVPHRG